MDVSDAFRSPVTTPTTLDRLIGWLDPRRGLSRHSARQLLARAYEAASPRDSWKPRRSGASANADHLADASVMRGKARSLVQNVSYMRAALEALVANVIGTGIVPVPEGPLKEEALKLWKQWVPVADADGQRDYYGLQNMAYRTMEQDGEVLVRYRWRREQDGLPVPLQLQLLEIDWLDTTRQSGALTGNVIVNGIEYDLLGRKVAYWLWDQHPGDMTLKRGTRIQSSRVSANLIQHLFRPERPGQGRGFTRFAPVISSARDVRLLQDAELARKNLETRLGVLVSGDASLFTGTPQSLTPEESRKTGELGNIPSGGMVNIPAGMNVTTVAPNPALGFTDYLKLELHLIMAGFGVPYESATGDLSGVNFSSMRAGQQNFRRNCEQTQWLDVIPGFCNPVWSRFVEAARMVGKLRGSEPIVADHSTPKWNYVTPMQDVGADVAEIGSGTQSISEIIRRKGYDPEKVFTELGSDITRLKEIGVLDGLMALLKGNSMGQPPGGTPPP